MIKKDSVRLTGWGRNPIINSTSIIPNSLNELLSFLKNYHGSYIARGNGRSYGDSSINKELTINMRKLNRVISWNNANGELIAESGIMIDEIINLYLKEGWFPKITAGTKYITLGGAIASDIHGKNHHIEGSFRNCINWFEIVTDQNEIKRCSKKNNQELFHWTIGGMGLTGLITKCSINLKKVQTGWINEKVVINNNLDETLRSFELHNASTYSVAWIDALSNGKNFGRSVLRIGEHAKLDGIPSGKEIFPKDQKRKLSIFFNFPSFFLNNFFVKVFNQAYFYLSKRKSSRVLEWDSYFYPLDSIKNWNKMYGSRGFFQFQCLIPAQHARDGLKDILKIVRNDTSGSFLAVLKKFEGLNHALSFPSEGYTLALDFKYTKKNVIAAKSMIALIKNFNGKIYLTKDSIMSEQDFSSIYSKEILESFAAHRNKDCISEQSIRLNI